jgi:hypothetical protein
MAIYIAAIVVILIIVLLLLRRMTRAGEPTESVEGRRAGDPPEHIDETGDDRS